jgi:histidine kinase
LLGVRRAPAGLRIEVWDTGCGIPINKTEEIFEEFRRLDSPQAGVERGAGLGLAIVRTIAGLLGYPVTVRSWVGRGSVFSIEVPRGDASRLQEVTDTVPTDEQTLRGRRVWCIDDDGEVREATRTLLERWGCDVTLCVDGDDCLRTARGTEMPDLLILDYRLGNRVGPELLPELESIWGRSVPVVIVSGERTALLRKALREAPWPVLAKPIRPEELRAGMLAMLIPAAVDT